MLQTRQIWGVEFGIDTSQWLIGFNRYHVDGSHIWNVFFLCFRVGCIS